jgi:hypothetical protein
MPGNYGGGKLNELERDLDERLIDLKLELVAFRGKKEEDDQKSIDS